MRGEHLPKALLTPALEQIFVVISQLIMASSMTSQENKALLETIANWTIGLWTVALKPQSRATERGEGKNGHEDSEADWGSGSCALTLRTVVDTRDSPEPVQLYPTKHTPTVQCTRSMVALRQRSWPGKLTSD